MSYSIGASTCIVRNKSLTSAVSPLALQEAGTVAVCRSVAWTNKTLTSAWWVHAHQVSKAAPSGEFLVSRLRVIAIYIHASLSKYTKKSLFTILFSLHCQTTGSFMIYGKKNFLPPSTLEMGFGVMFRLEDSCVAAHVSERRDRIQVSENEDLESVYSEAYDRYGINMDSVTGASGGSEYQPDDSTADELTISIDENTTISKKTKNLLRKAHLTSKNSHSNVNLSHVSNSSIINSVIKESDEEDDDGEEDENEGEGEKQAGGKQQSAHQRSAPGRTNQKPSSSSSQQPRQSQQQGQQQMTKQPKKKKLDARKTRRYAEQDEEDKILALSLLGHSTLTLTLLSSTDNSAAAGGEAGGVLNKRVIILPSNQDKQNQLKQQQKEKSIQQKQLRAGIRSTTGNSSGGSQSAESGREQWSGFPVSVQSRVSELMRRWYDPSTHTVYDKVVKTWTPVNEYVEMAATTAVNANTSTVTSGTSDDASSTTTSATATESNSLPSQQITAAEPADYTQLFPFLKPNEIDSYELKSLSSFHSEEHMLEILRLFEMGFLEKKGRISNKSGFLAGIMKRFQKDLLSGKLVMHSTNDVTAASASTEYSEHINVNNNDDDDGNGTDVKDELEPQTADEEGDESVAAEADALDPLTHLTEDISADDIDQLTGCPLPSDTLLYAVPVVGPFQTLQRYKYRVKLTPGTGKKGKVCKQALEVFLAQSIQNFNNSGGSGSGSQHQSLTHYGLLNASSAATAAAGAHNNSQLTASVSNHNHEFKTQNIENMLLKGLTDTEMVAIMMPEVKISTPGLQQLKTKAKKVQRGQKASK